MSLETHNLSALYAHYQIDPQRYPPPDLQLSNLIHQSYYPSYLYEQPSTIPTSIFSTQQENSNRKSREWKRNRTRLRSSRPRRKNNKHSATNRFHQRNMVTVRRISCQDMLDIQMMKKNRLEQTNLQQKRNNKARLATVIENKSQTYKTSRAGFDSLPSPIKIHTSSTQSTIRKLLISSPVSNSRTNTLTISSANDLFQQHEVNKKLSESLSTTGLKMISVQGSSSSSLESTHLHAINDNLTKPDMTITKSNISDSLIDCRAFDDNSSHRSTSIASIVPHFLSTIAPHVPFYMSSSTAGIPNALKTESRITPTVPNETIHDLLDQLKTCLAALSRLLQNQTEHKKQIDPNGTTYLDEKKRKTKTKPPLTLPSSTPPAHWRYSKKAISNEDKLVSEDITVGQCHISNRQEEQSMLACLEISKLSETSEDRKLISSWRVDQHEEFKRCLLVYQRDRVNKNHSENMNGNEMQKDSFDAWNRSPSNKHLSLSQSTDSLSENKRVDSSISESSLILAEKDNECQSLNELLGNIISLK